MKTVKTTPIQQQGSTLIEILVSMFILALGLMALIAMQTRTSIGIKEAENQTVIAQATENLAENMMTNPYLDIGGLTTQKSYDHYTGSFNCTGSRDPDTARPTNAVSGATARTALAAYHLADFRQMACSVIGVEGDVTVAVNNNTTTAGGVGSNAAAGQTLHVIWKMDGSSDKTYTYDYPLDDNL